MEIKQKLSKEKEREHIYLLKNNIPFAWYEGERDYVNLPDSDYIKIKNSDIYHNHLKGYSFSKEDVSMTIEYNAKSLIVVTSEAEYILERPGKKWGFKFQIDKAGKLYSDKTTCQIFEESITIAEDMLHRKIVMGELSQTEKIISENHYIWDMFFELNLSNTKEMFSEGRIVLENGIIKSIPYPEDLPAKLGWDKEKYDKLDAEFEKEKEKLKLKFKQK